MTNQHAWDVFISHASEDKTELVAPVANALRRFGLRVWYDEFTLSVGDSLSRSIDNGLAQSRFGVVVLSPSFFAKNWPEYELRGLIARELGRDKVILPLWHKVTRDDVLAFSPTLADKVAIPTDGLTPVQIAVKVIEVVSPTLFERIHRRLAYLQAKQAAPVEMADVDTLHESPIRHQELTKEQLDRIRLIRAALLDVRPLTMQDWVDGFRRDLHPADEILVWEHHAAVFLEVAAYLRLSPQRRKELFLLLVTVMQGAPSEDIAAAVKRFGEKEAIVVLQSLGATNPVIEFALPKAQKQSRPGGTRRMATKRVNVPDDDQPLPDELPADLMRDLLKRTENSE